MPTFGLYAKEWVPVFYTVTYNGNGNTSGSVPVDSNSYEEGDSVTVLGNTGSLAKGALSFKEWNTAPDGSGTSYDGWDTFAMPDANVILYAVYVMKYTVTYNGNGNTSGIVAVDSNSYETGNSVTVLGNTGSLFKGDLTFIKWNTAPDDSGTSYDGGDTFNMGAANVILYAVYATVFTLVSDATWLTATSVTGGDNTCPATPGLSPAFTAIGYDDSSWVNAAVWSTHKIWAPGALIDRGPPLTAYFRKTFFMPGTPLSGSYLVDADDCAQTYINGQLVDDGVQPGAAIRGPFNILPYLQVGVNIIAVKAWDGANCSIYERGNRAITIDMSLGYSPPEIPPPNPPYGNHETPVSLGSGSGYYHVPTDYLGHETRGGGAVEIIARSGTVSVNGRVNMNGQDGTYAGGASGGSIWIKAWKIDGTGFMSSEGGDTLLTQDQTAGGGGGGYISLWHGHTIDFDGTMSVEGGGYISPFAVELDGTHAGDGKIFIKEMEPILEDRFTGTIWNTKWWAHTNSVTIDNDLTLSNPDSTYLDPEVNSLFSVSGKEITATIDYAPSGSDTSQYSASFLLYHDEQNWVGLARRQTGLFGISSAGGIISASGVYYPNTDVTMRLMKNDSTFLFQYYDATSAPQTIYTDYRPELADLTWNIKMILNKPLSTDTLRTDYLRLTPLDISRQYIELDGTPADQSAVALNAIQGTSQYFGLDFYVEGNRVKWDSSGFADATLFKEVVAWQDVVRIQYEWDQTSNNGIDILFDSFKIFDGVISNAETTEPVLYVDPAYGSDTSSGRQLEPLQNLFVATAWAKRGGTVVLYDGTHNPTSISRKNLTLRGAEGVNSYVTTEFVQDTTGSNWEDNGVSFYGCDGIVENVDFTSCRNAIICENGDYSLLRNTIVDTSSAVKFINCDPVIARNFVRFTEYAFDFTSSRAPYIYSNVVCDASIAVVLGDTYDATISNNTLDNNQIHVKFKEESSGAVTSNNLTYGTVGIEIAGDASVVSYNNNFYATTLDYNGSVVDATNSINANPLYYDRSNRDYHLNAGSPDIGTGLNTYDDYLFDFDGARRLNEDMGAFQYIDGTHVTGNYYVTSAGDDHWDFGGLDDPFRTLDKAMSVADSTIVIDGGHYDSFYLNLRSQNIDINQLYVYLGSIQHFASYITLTAEDLTHGYVDLPTFVAPDDSSHVAVNVIGGPSQELGVDFTIEYSSLVWNNYLLENFLAIGDTLRVVFLGPLQRKALNTLILHQYYSDYGQEKAIFVSPSGSDSTVLGGDGTNSGGNGTMELPYRTIDMALSQSNSGDSIVAMAGEYPIFSGLNDRSLVAGHDRTSVPERSFRRYFEDFFFPKDFRAYGATEYDPAIWSFDSTGSSEVFSGGGFLNITFDGTNAATADSSFDFVNDFELTATMRNAIDPVTFRVTSPDNTAFFTYNDSRYAAGVITGSLNTTCTGTLTGGGAAYEECLITEYISITADDTRNKYAALSYIPEPSDCSNVVLNLVGGVPQNYAEDFYVEDSKIKWDGMSLDGEIEPGEVLRAIYLDRSLSYPVTASISLEGERFTIRAFDGTWHTVMKRDMAVSYTGPWKAAFTMNTTDADISHHCIYGKGFVNKFLAVAESFDNLSIEDKSYNLRTERRNIAFYEES